MVGTIVRIIKSAARKSTEEGIAKYETYFVKTNKFLKYKSNVDERLIRDGFSDIIVE